MSNKKIRIEETDDVDWCGLPFTLYINELLPQEKREAVKKLLDAWYEIGRYGGFEGHLHYISDVGFEEENGTSIVEWWVDMGSTQPIALDVLIRSLEGWVQDHSVAIDKLVLGFRHIS